MAEKSVRRPAFFCRDHKGPFRVIGWATQLDDSGPERDAPLELAFLWALCRECEGWRLIFPLAEDEFDFANYHQLVAEMETGAYQDAARVAEWLKAGWERFVNEHLHKRG